MHEREIILSEAAQNLLEISISPLIASPIPELKDGILYHSNTIEVLTKTLDDQKRKIAEVNQLKNNLEVYLHSSHSIDIAK